MMNKKFIRQRLHLLHKVRLSMALSLLAAAFLINTTVLAEAYQAPQPYTYDNFPEYTHSDKGVKTIVTTGNEISVRYLPSVPYVKRAEGERSLQLLLPHTRNIDNGKLQHRFPLIVYVQGSAWLKQDVYINTANLAKFAARGYAIAIVQYRESSLAPFPAQIQDAKTAIRFMRMHGAAYNIDTNNVFVWGDSSGGHTAVLTGLTAGTPELDTDTYGTYSCKVNGVVDVFGPTDIRRMNDFPSTWEHRAADSPEGQFIGGLQVDQHEAEAAKTVAANYVSSSRKQPPVLIFHGTKDRLVSYNQSELLYEKLKACGQDVTMYRLKGADHGDTPFWSEQVLAIIDKFMQSHLQ
jgi:acetyl esterase/lipase